MQIESWFIHTWYEDIYYEKSILPWVPCRTLILHGAWKSDITRTTALRECLYMRWIPTLALDFSWHGRSSSNQISSIQKKISEAQEIGIKLLDSTERITIIWFSMSGEISLRLTQYFDVEKLALFAPGIYHREAIDIHFWDWFSALIRTHESWKNHDLERILLNYSGSIYLLTPEHDEVIPEWVNDEIMSVGKKVHKKRIIIPWAPHMIWKWMNENPERIDEILDQIGIWYSNTPITWPKNI